MVLLEIIQLEMPEKFQNKYRIPSARAKWWNYSQDGAYFITIVTHDRECYFGNIVEKNIKLTLIGEIAQSCWQDIPKHFPFVMLDSFVIMPNHVHGIIVIRKTDNTLNNNVLNPYYVESVETLHATSLHQIPKPNKNEHMASISPKQASLGSIVRSYKSAVTRNAHVNHFALAWQPRYYEHIIRSKRSHQRISKYIIRNPSIWDCDKFRI